MSEHEVLLPSMGEGVMEATIVRWIKQIGDKITKDDPIVEVATDKVDTEIPALQSGFLVSQMVKEGDTVAVDQILGHISESQSASSTEKTMPVAKKEQEQPIPSLNPYSTTHNTQTSDHSTSIRAKSSPLVRKIAKEHGINLVDVPGSGMGGRINKSDLEEYLKEKRASPVDSKNRESSPQGPSLIPTADRSLKTASIDGYEYLEGVQVNRQPMTRMRQMIADHMCHSVRTSPHVTTVFEVDMHTVTQIRDIHKQEFQQREGFNLTYTPFFIYGTVQALKRHPELNSSIDGYDLLLKKDINIGIAVAVPTGLLVPVIKKAGELSFIGIARQLHDLATRAREKKLQPSEITGGTFSITNPGGFGSLTSNPIINQPQVDILGIGSIVKRPVVVDDLIGIRPLCLISITFDHRAIDGEGGAKFLATLKEELETFSAQPL